MAPGVGLLHAAGHGIAADEAGQHQRGVVPVGGVERFQGLVGKVKRVAGVDIPVVGDGSKEHVGNGGRRGAALHGRDNTALGALGITHLDKLAEPTLERLRIRRPARERPHREAGWAAGGVTGYGRQSLVERPRPVFGVEQGRHVHEAGEHRQPLAPAAVTIARAKAQPNAEGLGDIAPVFHQLEDGLAQQQRNILFQPHFQPLAVVGVGIGRRCEVDPDFAGAHLDGIGGHIVGPEVEAAAAAEVEAGMMPVAGKDAVADRAPVEWKAHMRAAVVDGVDAVLVLKERQGVAVDLDRQLALPYEIGQVGGEDEAGFMICHVHSPLNPEQLCRAIVQQRPIVRNKNI